MDWGDRIETKGSCWVSQKFRSESVFVSSLGHGEEEERKNKQDIVLPKKMKILSHQKQKTSKVDTSRF